MLTKLKNPFIPIAFFAFCLCIPFTDVHTQEKDRSSSKPEEQLMGFIGDHDNAELAREKQFNTYLDRADYNSWLKILSARPHNIGSPYDKHNAEYIDSLYRSFGFDSKIEEFSVLFPTPKFRLLEMVAPQSYTALLSEPPLAEDSTSGETDEQLPVYNAYSIDGDVTAELVYVNYGVPKDYEELARHGIDVKGKIVIARYGGSWRGIKPKVAAEHGAIGCIIYSDPHEDGYFEGDVYPKGAYRSDRGAQRGSVADMPLYSGDPLTPFIGATKDAHRLPINEAKTLTKIPVLPISYGDALPLLREMGGPVAPEEWRGALPITYHIGPGPAKVHLKLEFNWNMVPAYDVIAKLRGSDYPDEWIIRGNHHDAWVNGAGDPLSGQVATLEEGKALGLLVKSGWKPKRTIVYCAWDGEEPGLLGSTEWVETHADELKNNGVVYINSDGNGRGYLSMGGSHSLEKFVNQVAVDVRDPEKGISVKERNRAMRVVGGRGDDKKEAMQRKDLRIYPLGSGSDYTPFLQHIGIASLSIGYGGEGGGGEYHSIYDSYDHYMRFGDPGFDYGVALSQTGGRIVMRMANADILPFEYTDFFDNVSKFVKEVTKLADDMREETEDQNSMIKDSMYAATADPKEITIPPPQKDRVPHFNFAPLQNALTELKTSAAEYDEAAKKLKESSFTISGSQIKKLDELLIKTERVLTTKDGLPRRPWYVHQIYAPGFYTGYGVKTLPGVREALEERKWKEVDPQVEITAKVLEDCAKEIRAAANVLSEK
ncbi:MAG: transferrin receptor-like dimerization domain-containing protein [Bacteroidota bacterium]